MYYYNVKLRLALIGYALYIEIGTSHFLSCFPSRMHSSYAGMCVAFYYYVHRMVPNFQLGLAASP